MDMIRCVQNSVIWIERRRRGKLQKPCYCLKNVTLHTAKKFNMLRYISITLHFNWVSNENKEWGGYGTKYTYLT